MNYTYFGNRIERSPLGNMGLQLLEAQEKLVSQEYEIENLRIKAAIYKAYFFRNSILAEKLEKQSEENRDAYDKAKRNFESREHRELFDGVLKVCQIPSIIGILDE